MAEEEKICFVICPIGPENSEIREQSDKILKYIIRPAAKACGYRTVRPDKMPEPGIITDQIVEKLLQAHLVIADLTDYNANVFYELAIRHASRKPVIQIMRAGQRPPFDLYNVRTVAVDTDVSIAEQAVEQIEEQIRAAEAVGHTDNVLSKYLDYQAMVATGDASAKTMADVLAAISDLRTGQAKLADLIHSGPSAHTHGRLTVIRKAMIEKPLIDLKNAITAAEAAMERKAGPIALMGIQADLQLAMAAAPHAHDAHRSDADRPRVALEQAWEAQCRDTSSESGRSDD